MRGPFTWDARSARYRDAAGRFVSRTDVRRALDSALDAQQRRLLAIAEDVRAGKLTLRVFRDEMQAGLKELHLYSAAAARGGWAQMSPADFGRVGRELRDQYGYLDRFVRDIRAGRQRLDGSFIVRVKMYAQSGRGTYHVTEGIVMRALGMTEERNILNRAAEHCISNDEREGCEEVSAQGWQPLGTLTPIGDRVCLTNCRCEMAYR